MNRTKALWSGLFVTCLALTGFAALSAPDENGAKPTITPAQAAFFESKIRPLLIADCYSCHERNAATDTTFVQFYPPLIEAAKARGTYRDVE